MMSHRFVPRIASLTVVAGLFGIAQAQQIDLPTVIVDHDDVIISQSCRLIVPKGVFIPDSNNNGVVHIAASDITIECVDGEAELIADPERDNWDRKSGIGYVIRDVKNVTLRNAHAHRYKVNILAVNADGLVLDRCDVAGGYAQRLKSTPEREDSGDWLFPHNNDDREWVTQHGAAICIENSSDVTVRNCYTRRRQNGLILDRVTDSRIYDNDFSFLSGWGIAMWRSSRNIIARNQTDFCIRGYSHDIYNRGQDSAGILMFEQCNDNIIAENSATHSGDGLFAFAGREALGEFLEPNQTMPSKMGNNRNQFFGNDFSYAAAHGLELTFSFDNTISGNTFIGNAICGIWGGFSQDTAITHNLFERNGDKGYGLERGGINIEHSKRNTIVSNRFVSNECGVHLWWDDPGGLAGVPWYKLNYGPLRSNRVVNNAFRADKVGIQIRDDAINRGEKIHFQDTRISANTFVGVQIGEDVPPDISVEHTTEQWLIDSMGEQPPRSVPGTLQAVGARKHLAGRQNIVMTEWFPWDHKAPTVVARPKTPGSGTHEYRIYSKSPMWFGTAVDQVYDSGVGVRIEPMPSQKSSPDLAVSRVLVDAVQGENIVPYDIRITHNDEVFDLIGEFSRMPWQIRTFPWTPDPATQQPAPPDDELQWQDTTTSWVGTVSTLDLTFGGSGPKQAITRVLENANEVVFFEGADTQRDYFGIVAETTAHLSPGTWSVETVSDDGIRVHADGAIIIENWTHHAPEHDNATITVDPVEHPNGKDVTFRVEYFEIMGHAVLKVDVKKIAAPE
ncbi:MAG: right-handed parallel beta-helix repeat-containing protein [Phycisphaeraceae bacterium]|nr:right-handed parallel beta-helix repeat-containing protein [Phycisphaerales bacterium]MCB9858921.1 right-handed parallel beta-helix repeat-containing protein [Phycisphaeraceae bacterium]